MTSTDGKRLHDTLIQMARAADDKAEKGARQDDASAHDFHRGRAEAFRLAAVMMGMPEGALV